MSPLLFRLQHLSGLEVKHSAQNHNDIAMYLSSPKFWQKHKSFSHKKYCSVTVCPVMMLTILNYTPDAVVPLNTEQEAPMVEIGVTDLEGGSNHFSQEVTNVQVPPTSM